MVHFQLEQQVREEVSRQIENHPFMVQLRKKVDDLAIQHASCGEIFDLFRGEAEKSKQSEAVHLFDILLLLILFFLLRVHVCAVFFWRLGWRGRRDYLGLRIKVGGS